MASLRVAMKLSMAEAKVPPTKETEQMRDPPQVRKRNSSIGDQSNISSSSRNAKKARKESDRSNKSSNSSVDTYDRTVTEDDDVGDKSTRSNSPQMDSIVNQDENTEATEEHENETMGREDGHVNVDNQQTHRLTEEEADNQHNTTIEGKIPTEIHEDSSTTMLVVHSDYTTEPLDYENVKTDNHEEAITKSKMQKDNDPSEVITDQAESADPSQQMKKVKKKRTPSILKALGLDIIPETEIPAAASTDDPNEEEVGRRYASSRTAAAVAKTKLSAKAGRNSSDVPENEIGLLNNATKGRKEKSKQIPEPLEWVCCDRCSKWRRIPLSANIKEGDLPDKWFCEMSTWSTQYNTCDAEDQGGGEDDGATQGNLTKLEDVINEKTGTSRATKGRGKSRKEVEVTEVISTEIVKREGENRRRGKGSRNAVQDVDNVQGTKLERDSVAVADIAKTNWVQCNKCSKWRKAPLSVDVDALPETWFCENNTWNPSVARCSAREEEEEDTTAEASTPVAATTPVSAPREKKRLPGVKGANNTAASIAVSNINWVQCEKKDCKKWRKVPAHVDMSKLPEKWYCHMNTWNTDLAACDAPEESDNEVGVDHVPASQMLAPPNQKALSYRKILFGNDGRMRMCFTDKNKAGTGIFTYMLPHQIMYAGTNDEELDPRRRVSYWWSSAYDEAAANQSITQSSATGNSVKQKSVVHEDNANMECTYMLDSLRRIYDMGCQPPSALYFNDRYTTSYTQHGHPKKRAKSFRLLSQLTILQRLRAECSVVRSCFLASSTSSMLFVKLLEALKNCRFLNPHVDACREFMSEDILKSTLRRMEESYELEVYHTKDSQLVVCLLMSTENLRNLVASKSSRYNKIVNKQKFGDKWSKEGYPLKLRKFFLNKNHVVNQQFNLINVGEKGSRRQRNAKAGNSQTGNSRKKQGSEKAAGAVQDQDPDMSIMMEQDHEQDQQEQEQEQQELTVALVHDADFAKNDQDNGRDIDEEKEQLAQAEEAVHEEQQDEEDGEQMVDGEDAEEDDNESEDGNKEGKPIDHDDMEIDRDEEEQPEEEERISDNYDENADCENENIDIPYVDEMDTSRIEEH